MSLPKKRLSCSPSRLLSPKLKSVERSKWQSYHLANFFIYSIERDALLLANRIALLKQEEIKTWKKIDDTKKRTNEILSLKKRNEERIQKVRYPE